MFSFWHYYSPEIMICSVNSGFIPIYICSPSMRGKYRNIENWDFVLSTAAIESGRSDNAESH